MRQDNNGTVPQSVKYAIIGAGIHGLSVVLATMRCRRRCGGSLPPPKDAPSVTIVQPLCGVETFSRETLRSIFALDYPSYEIIFCLASGDDPNAAAGSQCVVRRQRAIDETAGVNRSKSGPDDIQEIGTKTGVRLCQCVCLGSDQAESPVTTSNFLRRELTTWLALSLVASCSMSHITRVRAASTSVMAPSEK